MIISRSKDSKKKKKRPSEYFLLFLLPPFNMIHLFLEEETCQNSILGNSYQKGVILHFRGLRLTLYSYLHKCMQLPRNAGIPLRSHVQKTDSLLRSEVLLCWTPYTYHVKTFTTYFKFIQNLQEQFYFAYLSSFIFFF